MQEKDSLLAQPVWQRGVRLLLLAVFAVAATGYFVGLQQTRQATQQPVWLNLKKAQAKHSTQDDVPLVVNYTEMPHAKLGPNHAWNNDLTQLLKTPLPLPPKVAADREQVAQSLAQRAGRRAFDGGPPVIPHPTTQMSTTACMVCHKNGLRIGARLAPKMCHPFFANCTQCHVDVTTNLPPTLMTVNDFDGLPSPSRGDRAFATAPPSIPHPLWMRQDCLSCHGPTGPSALRTTHPERQSCTQCHVPAATVDRLNVFSKGRDKE